MFPTAGPLGFPIGTASRMLVVKVDLRLKRSMSASGTFETCRLALKMSVHRAGPDVVAPASERRD